VDLGCGTGAGTFALLDRFPDAHITAVDASADHLQRLRTKACARGVEDRVRTVQATSTKSLAGPRLTGPVWASASMHHMAHPDRALRTVHDALAPAACSPSWNWPATPVFCPRTPLRTGPASKSASMPRPTAAKSNTCPTAVPTGARC